MDAPELSSHNVEITSNEKNNVLNFIISKWWLISDTVSWSVLDIGKLRV